MIGTQLQRAFADEYSPSRYISCLVKQTVRFVTPYDCLAEPYRVRSEHAI